MDVLGSPDSSTHRRTAGEDGENGGPSCLQIELLCSSLYIRQSTPRRIGEHHTVPVESSRNPTEGGSAWGSMRARSCENWMGSESCRKWMRSEFSVILRPSPL